MNVWYICVYAQPVPKTHECWKLSAVDLLCKCDDLVKDMAMNLTPSCINGMYICMCISVLEIVVGHQTFSDQNC